MFKDMFTPNFWEDEPKFDKRRIFFLVQLGPQLPNSQPSQRGPINSQLEIFVDEERLPKTDVISYPQGTRAGLAGFQWWGGNFGSFLDSYTYTSKWHICYITYMLCLNNFSLHWVFDWGITGADSDGFLGSVKRSLRMVWVFRHLVFPGAMCDCCDPEAPKVPKSARVCLLL